jgi:hypothetical protein
MVLRRSSIQGREELDSQREMERLTAFIWIVADEPAEGQGTSWVQKERWKCNIRKRLRFDTHEQLPYHPLGAERKVISLMSEYHVIGKRLPRIDAKEKVRGQAHYTDDLKLPGMLCGMILRSPFAHAGHFEITQVCR